MRKVSIELETEIVRLYAAEHMKIGEIARHLMLHHSVVRRVLHERHICVPASYKRPSKLDAYREWMADSLEKYPRIRASRLFAMAQERGYSGGISQFRAQVRCLRPVPTREAFLRLHKLPGEEAQVDWAHFGKVNVGRAQRPLVMFAMTLSHSRMLFVRFFHDAQQANFQAGHVEAFAFFGGVARSVLYDNLKSAVLERIGGVIRFNPALLELAKHYCFEAKAAAPARGNEKGRVERAIRYVRDNFFAGRTWQNLAILNEEARHWCLAVSSQRKWADDRRRLIHEVWSEEQAKLLALPEHPFVTHQRVEVNVGKTPHVHFDRNRYSVPHNKVGQAVTILADAQLVRVVQQSFVLAEHPRSYSQDETIEHPEHLHALLEAKRQASISATASILLNSVPASQTWLELAAKRGFHLHRLHHRLLDFLQRYGADLLNRALLEVLPRETIHLRSLETVLDNLQRASGVPPPGADVSLPSERLRHIVVRPHDLTGYAQLEYPPKKEGPHDEPA